VDLENEALSCKWVISIDRGKLFFESCDPNAGWFITQERGYAIADFRAVWQRRAAKTKNQFGIARSEAFFSRYRDRFVFAFMHADDRPV
jgi:hypothetical protein